LLLHAPQLTLPKPPAADAARRADIGPEANPQSVSTVLRGSPSCDMLSTHRAADRCLIWINPLENAAKFRVRSDIVADTSLPASRHGHRAGESRGPRVISPGPSKFGPGIVRGSLLQLNRQFANARLGVSHLPDSGKTASLEGGRRERGLSHRRAQPPASGST
jgi:hypothetical protein